LVRAAKETSPGEMRFLRRLACPLRRNPAMTRRSPPVGYFLAMRVSWVALACRNNPLTEAMTALANAWPSAVRRIVFDRFRAGRLVGEISVLIKRRHPEVQAEVDRAYQERLAKLVKGGDPAAQDD
jgi:hypothetical protein